MMPMALVLSACLWSGIALTAGLISGSGWLRVGGIAGLVVFGFAAFLLVRLSEPAATDWRDDGDWGFEESFNDWPRRTT